MLSHTGSGVDKLADLKGKVVAVGDLAGPDKNFFSIQLSKLGIDPIKEIDWGACPGNLLNVAVEKNEVQAFLSSDPLAWLWLKDSQYKELQPRRRIPGLELLHRRAPWQSRPRGAAGRARHRPGAARCSDVHLAEARKGRKILPALCAEGGVARRS